MIGKAVKPTSMPMLALVLVGLAAGAATAPRALAGGGGPAPAPKAAADPAAVPPPPAPNMGGVKDVLKDSAKEALGKLPGMGATPAAPAPGAAPQDPAAAATARLAMLRRKTLKDDDFLDNDERNRDPFRSYLRLFTTKEGPRAPKVPAIFEKFALEELTLIGIVSGDANPRAMFRDPSGLGQSIKRGDYITKSAMRVTKILSDRVILEVSEITATGETKPTEKPVLVNPEGAQK
jgi:Tfp pilus assembly protein PilP